MAAIHYHWMSDGFYVVEVYSVLQDRLEAGETLGADDFQEPDRLARTAGYQDAQAVYSIYEREDPAWNTAADEMQAEFLAKLEKSSHLLSGAARTMQAAHAARGFMELVGELYLEGWERMDAECGHFQ
jgi:hypothetical protein